MAWGPIQKNYDDDEEEREKEEDYDNPRLESPTECRRWHKQSKNSEKIEKKTKATTNFLEDPVKLGLFYKHLRDLLIQSVSL